MDLKYFNHPAGNFFLNEKLANMLLPLLREQNYLKKVEIYNGQNIEVDLDFFRKFLFNFCTAIVRFQIILGMPNIHFLLFCFNYN